ncbi:MAG: HlyD family efflux transporter periplasmic adaptor subunit, partial [Pseudomonadota bacterium]
LVTLREELEVQAQARQQQIGNISRLNEVRRQVTVTESALATFERENAVLDSAMAEAEQELAQVDLAFRAEAAEAITTIRAQFSSLDAERLALVDRQNRRQVFAPLDGVIIDLAYPSVGGVVPPGEAMFDIVPKDEIWRVDVRFDPKDRDDLAAGLDVNLRFGSLDPINPPEVSAQVSLIAADATFDGQNQIYFYSAEVGIDPKAFDALDDFTLSPGIPVEVFLDSGVTRTPLSYFIEPFEVMLRLGLRG